MIKIAPISFRSENPQKFAEAIVNGGMVTSIDASDLSNGQLVDAKNVHVRYDRISRRSGTTLYTPLKPNSLKILNIVPFKRFDGTVNVIRLTASTVHVGTAAWNPATGTLTGSADNRFSVTTLSDRLFFANGVDRVKELNTTTLTYADAGALAPRAKYITGFFNRLVCANNDVNPTEIDWSGDQNYSEFNPSVDLSAGFAFLSESPSDYADFITGLFGFASTMLILRERSLWLATKQPSATDPFNFFTAVPSIGCNAPYSAAQIPNGVAWFDLRTGTVWSYKIGTREPEQIGLPIEKTLVTQVTDPFKLFASYDNTNFEYSLAIPSDSSDTVKVWTYNFTTKAWSYDERQNLSCISDLDYSGTSGLVVDDLFGSVDSLLGSVDSLLGGTLSLANRVFGFDAGDITIVDGNNGYDLSETFNTTITSKVFRLPSDDEYIFDLLLEYESSLAGDLTVQYSKNGTTWTTYSKDASISATNGVRTRRSYKKLIKCSQYQFRVLSTTGQFDLIGYTLKTIQGASTRG